jgi:C4-dicarboxylate-specific signal transduction histidine kinase
VTRAVPPSDVHRLAELGMSAAGLVHELRQPLFAVKALAQLVAHDPDRAAELLPALLTQVSSLERLVDAYAELGRRPGSTAEVFAVRTPLVAAFTVVAPRATQLSVQLHLDAPADVRAYGSPTALQQAVGNLVRNAVEAVRGRPEPRVRVAVHAHEGAVLVRVSDNGPGVPPSEREAIFEPFHTTKSDGTGLGLPLSRALLAADGARLELSTSASEGAVFEVILPPASAATHTAGAATPSAAR